jgi:hypothetical protein
MPSNLTVYATNDNITEALYRA